MRLTFSVLTFHLVLVASTNTLLAAPLYHFTSLGTLGGLTIPAAINENGQVAGYSYIDNYSVHAFLYSDGTMRDLGTLPGGLQSRATGINELGQVVGYSISNVGSYIGLHTGFTYSNGVMHPLGNLPGKAESTPNGINLAGHIVGNSGTNPNYDGFSYANGAFTDLGRYKPNAINDSDQSVGTLNASSGWPHASLYQNGTVTDLGTLGGDTSSAVAITNDGKIVGSADVNQGLEHAFSYINGTMTDLGTLGHTSMNYSQGQGINTAGDVVGYGSVTGSTGLPHAFLSHDGTMYDLNNLVDGAGSGWLLQQANAINDKGWIVGYASDFRGDHGIAYLLTPIPEPDSLVLSGFGLIALVFASTYRRQS